MFLNRLKYGCAIGTLFLLFIFAQRIDARETKSSHIIHSASDFRTTNHGDHFQVSRNGLSPKSAMRGASYLSPALPAVIAFNAVGAHWLAEIPAGSKMTVFLRSSSDGENWGNWLVIPAHEEPVADESENGEPNRFAGDIVGALAFFDPESRFVQYRVDFSTSSSSQPLLKRMALQIIRSTDGPSIDHILKQKRSRSESAKGSVMVNKAAKPDMVTRAEWGAQPPRYDYTYTIVGHIAFHHTAAVSDYNVENKDDCAARVRAIQAFHQSPPRNWNDIGYAYTICKLGHIFQGREDDNDNNDVRGAHDAFNTGSQGVANLGYFHPPYNHQPTPALLNALHRLLAWKCDERNIDPQGRSLYAAYGSEVDHIYGHQEVRATACPGDQLFSLKQSIKDSVEKIIKDVTTSIADTFPVLPDDFAIMKSYPNPFVPGSAIEQTATIQLDLQKPEQISIAVHNILGQAVRQLYHGVAGTGKRQLLWDGKDDDGQLVPAGVYFYRLITENKVEINKVLLLAK